MDLPNGLSTTFRRVYWKVDYILGGSLDVGHKITQTRNRTLILQQCWHVLSTMPLSCTLPEWTKEDMSED